MMRLEIFNERLNSMISSKNIPSEQNVEVGINVEGGKSKNSINVEGGILFSGGWNFSKSVSVDSTFIREMRVVPN